ncbi:MAG: outer membrane beta-barrel protein [Thiohalomonadales bacterium]
MLNRFMMLYATGLVVSFMFYSIAQAEPAQLEFGLRGNVELANGTPANDILGYGIFGRYHINPKWGIGFAIDFADYDLENPAKKLNIPDSDPKIIDAKTSSTMISAWAERYFNDIFDETIVYTNFGLGVNSIDVDNAKGNVQGGGTYEIKTNVDSDIVLLIGVGIQAPLGNSWVFDSNLGFRQHFGTWSMQDLESSAKGTVDGFSSWIFQIGVTRKF